MKSDVYQSRRAGSAPGIPSLAAMLQSIPHRQLLVARVVGTTDRETALLAELRKRFAGQRFDRIDVAAAMKIAQNRAGKLVQKLVTAGLAEHVATEAAGRKVYMIKGTK